MSDPEEAELPEHAEGRGLAHKVVREGVPEDVRGHHELAVVP